MSTSSFHLTFGPHCTPSKSRVWDLCHLSPSMTPLILCYFLLEVMTLSLGVTGSPSSRVSTSTSSTEGTVAMTTDAWTYLESHIQVTCDSHYIQVRIPSPESEFSGMVYPQVSRNSDSDSDSDFGLRLLFVAFRMIHFPGIFDNIFDQNICILTRAWL